MQRTHYGLWWTLGVLAMMVVLLSSSGGPVAAAAAVVVPQDYSAARTAGKLLRRYTPPQQQPQPHQPEMRMAPVAEATPTSMPMMSLTPAQPLPPEREAQPTAKVAPPPPPPPSPPSPPPPPAQPTEVPSNNAAPRLDPENDRAVQPTRGNDNGADRGRQWRDDWRHRHDGQRNGQLQQTSSGSSALTSSPDVEEAQSSNAPAAPPAAAGAVQNPATTTNNNNNNNSGGAVAAPAGSDHGESPAGGAAAGAGKPRVTGTIAACMGVGGLVLSAIGFTLVRRRSRSQRRAPAQAKETGNGMAMNTLRHRSASGGGPFSSRVVPVFQRGGNGRADEEDDDGVGLRGQRAGILNLSSIQPFSTMSGSSCEQMSSPTLIVCDEEEAQVEQQQQQQRRRDSLVMPVDGSSRSSHSDGIDRVLVLEHAVHSLVTGAAHTVSTSGTSNSSSGGEEGDGASPETDDMPVMAQRMVIAPYEPALADELLLQPGDVVQVLRVFQDSWMLGRNKRTLSVGVFPSACLE
ncbi:hypothetical protein RI367_008464 [Sorochytrium milnesiophthora]